MFRFFIIYFWKLIFFQIQLWNLRYPIYVHEIVFKKFSNNYPFFNIKYKLRPKLKFWHASLGKKMKNVRFKQEICIINNYWDIAVQKIKVKKIRLNFKTSTISPHREKKKDFQWDITCHCICHSSSVLTNVLWDHLSCPLKAERHDQISRKSVRCPHMTEVRLTQRVLH